MQFAIDSNSSSHVELLYTIKNCIEKDMNTKKWKEVCLLDLWKKSQRIVCWKRIMCSVKEH
jgi:hypothetical protein